METTGYRTNRDHTETLAWEVRSDGTVQCDHMAPACCNACVEADSRLGFAEDCTVKIARWPLTAIREGRTVRYVPFPEV